MDKFDSFLCPEPEPVPTTPSEIEASQTMADPGIVLRPGSILGKYEIQNYLAEGGMGMVYLAKHKDLESKHAIKIIRRAYASRGDFVSRFLGEARIMAALDHRNIVRVTDFGEEDGRYYYVMDYVAGPDGPPRTFQDELQEALTHTRKKRGINEKRVKDVALQICKALNYAHSFPEGAVAHLDMKPSNIMIVGDPLKPGSGHYVKVTDFGFAKIVGRDSMLRSMGQSAADVTKSTGGAIAGTPRYMSPEQWQGEQSAGPASDIYSLGIIIYEALLGHVPQDVYPPPQPSSCGCSRDWNRIVRRCLNSDPKKRYSSAARIARDIKKIRFDQPKKKQIHRRRFTLSLILLGLCAVVFALQQFGVINDELVMEYRGKAEQLIDKGMKGVSEQLRPVGFLTIQSDPEIIITAVSESGDQLRLGTTDQFGRKIAIKLPEGYYHLVLSRAGYYPASERIQIEKGKVLMIERKLDAALSAEAPDTLEAIGKTKRRQAGSSEEPSQIRILCNVDSAGVYLGRRRLGRVNEYLYLKAHETHKLTIKAKGYAPADLEVSLSGLREDYRVNLAEAQGTLLIRSEVEGAGVFEKGKRIGSVGEKIPIEAGKRHTLEIRNTGYKLVRLTFEVPDEPPRMIEHTVNMTKREPVLRISAVVPPGYNGKPEAEVIIDGRSMGRHTLPLAYDGLDPGQHTVTIAPGPWKPMKAKKVTLEEGERSELTFNLAFLDAFLEFDVTPARASIYVDGRKKRDLKVSVEPDKKHDVRIWAKGHEAFTGQYAVGIGETNKIAVKLKKKRR